MLFESRNFNLLGNELVANRLVTLPAASGETPWAVCLVGVRGGAREDVSCSMARVGGSWLTCKFNFFAIFQIGAPTFQVTRSVTSQRHTQAWAGCKIPRISVEISKRLQTARRDG